MVALLPSPVLQFSDANGLPYAGGSLLTYIPGTTTPVTTWSESTGTTANLNPVPLDSAGECTIYASGAVRLILHDVSGNLIFDQPSNTLVSTAMAPVCIAPDLATARAAMGVTAAIATETSARIAADATTLASATSGVATETAARIAADGVNATAIATETAARIAADAALAASISASTLTKTGVCVTNSGGTGTVTFSPAFPTACSCVLLTVQGGAVGAWAEVQAVTTSGCTITTSSPLFGSGWAGGPCSVYWLATGN